MTISEKIRVRRKQLGWTQQQLADEVRRIGGGGCSKSLVYQWEHGKSMSRAMLERVAAALRCSVELVPLGDRAHE